MKGYQVLKKYCGPLVAIGWPQVSSHLKEPVLFEQSSYLGDFRESERISGPNEALDIRTRAHLEHKSHYRKLVHGDEDY